MDLETLSWIIGSLGVAAAVALIALLAYLHHASKADKWWLRRTSHDRSAGSQCVDPASRANLALSDPGGHELSGTGRGCGEVTGAAFLAYIAFACFGIPGLLGLIVIVLLLRGCRS